MTTDRTGLRLAKATLDAIIERADAARTGRDGEWRNHDVRDDFIRGIEAIQVHTLQPGLITTVSPRGRDWSYVGGEALRAARTALGLTGDIARTSETIFTLTYTPNPS